MSTFARIIDDVAVDVCRVPPDQAFCEVLALQFVAVPDEVVPGSRRSLDEFGGVIWTAPVVVAPPPPDYSALAGRHWEAIKAERDRRTQQGGYQVAGKWFHSDTFSRTQQMGLVMMGAGIPNGLQWKTMDGSFVAMTQTLAGQVFAAAAASDAELFARAEQIKAAMEADPVNFSLSEFSWPSIYGE